MQHTLETKFLAEQVDYLFPRQDEGYYFLYSIDFIRMVQTNLKTRKERRLLRRPLFVSEEDVRASKL